MLDIPLDEAVTRICPILTLATMVHQAAAAEKPEHPAFFPCAGTPCMWWVPVQVVIAGAAQDRPKGHCGLVR